MLDAAADRYEELQAFADGEVTFVTVARDRHTIDELHGHERAPVPRRAGAEELGDRWVVEACHRLAFEGEPAAETGLWLNVLEQLQTGEMPPEKKPRPSEQELAALRGWIDEHASKAALAFREKMQRPENANRDRPGHFVAKPQFRATS